MKLLVLYCPWALLCACRMYATQPALEHREKYIEIDDVRRKQREAREREKEAQLLDSMYKVGVNECAPGVAVHGWCEQREPGVAALGQLGAGKGASYPKTGSWSTLYCCTARQGSLPIESSSLSVDTQLSSPDHDDPILLRCLI